MTRAPANGGRSLASSGPVRIGPRVLLVEDSATSARATATMLAGGGVVGDVEVVHDAEKALDYLRHAAVDLIVLDLSLPGHQGLDLLADVRSAPDWKTLPVVVLSGITDASVVQRTYELGANCFVRKPTRVVELAPAVRAIEQFWTQHAGPVDKKPDGSVFQLPLAATGESVREARDTVRRLLTTWGMEAIGDTAELCTSELATNAVIHARSPVLLVVARLANGVRVGVEDESPAGLEPGSLEGHGESGRGLAIVDALCECWGVDPTADGKTVWFQLRQPDGDDG
jgi:CheY-like chemotaxis protein/anti-sigma regulatory factor (Ser/Thr protein kinase)